MIPTITINNTDTVVTEGSKKINYDNETDADFSKALNSVLEEGTEKTKSTEKKADDETVIKDQQEKKIDGTWNTLLEQLYQLADLIGQQAGTELEEAVSTEINNIIGVLEGNGVSGDTDIATLLTEIQDRIEQLGSEEKETITARMPQLLELFEEADNTVTEDEIQLSSNLCPLENSSEPVQMTAKPLSTMIQDADALSAKAADLGSGAETVSENITAAVHTTVAVQTDDVQMDTEQADTAETMDSSSIDRQAESQDAQKEQGGGTASDDDTADKLTDAKQADKTAKVSDSSTADTEDYARTVTASSANTPTNEAVKTAADNALSKLSDILSSYDEQVSEQFEIQLEPENLGKLSISLSMGEDGLKALIRTSDTQVQSLLSSEINALVDKLSENGVEIKSLDVICADMGGQQLDSRNSGNSFYGQQTASYGSTRAEDAQTAYEELNITQIAMATEELLGSTVSYRA